MMKFSNYDADSGTNIEVSVHDNSTLDEVLVEFQNFLRGCGYVILYDQSLELVYIDE
jgi:hypothetical protein